MASMMTEQDVNDAFGADNSLERMQELLNKGLTPTQHFGYAGTPMTMAVETEDIEMVKLMLQHGGDLNQIASIEHKPALWFAVQNESEEMIRFLLAHGAKLNGSGALHQAVLQVAPPSLLQLLLQNGADPLELETGFGAPGQDHRPLTALHRAARPQVNANFQAERLDKEPHLDMVRTLLKLGVDRHAKTESGLTALDIARSRDDIPRVAELLASWDETAAAPKS